MFQFPTLLLDSSLHLTTPKKAIAYFPKSCQTIRRWIDEITACFDNRTTQGTVEGINNKLKVIKRRGYGFRNFKNFSLRCLLN
jgi:transposase